MRMSSIMRCRSGLMDWVDSVMALLLVSDEADCLSTEHKKQITSRATCLRSWIGAPLPRERMSVNDPQRTSHSEEADIERVGAGRDLGCRDRRRPGGIPRLRLAKLAR